MVNQTITELQLEIAELKLQLIRSQATTLKAQMQCLELQELLLTPELMKLQTEYKAATGANNEQAAS